MVKELRRLPGGVVMIEGLSSILGAESKQDREDSESGPSVLRLNRATKEGSFPVPAKLRSRSLAV